MKVNQCVCIGMTFAQLKEIAEREKLDYDGLRKQTRCCTSCRACRPYVLQMLKTGEVEFPLLGSSDATFGEE